MSTKVKWLKTKQDLGQIYSSGLEYSFINEANEQCTVFCYCKDFLHDAVHGLVNNQISDIYGFVYDPNKMPHISLESTILALTNSSDNNFWNKIENTLDFINQIEKALRLRRTVAVKCANPPSEYKKCGVYIFTGSSRWLEAPPMLSMYSLLLRIGFIHKKGDTFDQTIKRVCKEGEAYQEEDAEMLEGAKKGIDRIMEEGYRKIFFKDIKKNYPKKIDPDTLHDDFGIVGFTNAYPKYHVKYWFKDKTKSKVKAESASETVKTQTPA